MVSMHRHILFVVALFSSALELSSAERTLHTFKRVTLTTEFWSEGAGVADFDKDGKMDVVSGPYWYAGSDFKRRHEIHPAIKTHTNKTSDGTLKIRPGWSPKNYSDNFFSFPQDFNGDGWPDVLVVGFPGKDASWFENPGKKSDKWKRYVVFDVLDNESPQWADLTGDGKAELVCNHNGYFGYAAPDWKRPEAPWRFHAISPKGEWRNFTHGHRRRFTGSSSRDRARRWILSPTK